MGGDTEGGTLVFTPKMPIAIAITIAIATVSYDRF